MMWQSALFGQAMMTALATRNSRRMPFPFPQQFTRYGGDKYFALKPLDYQTYAYSIRITFTMTTPDSKKMPLPHRVLLEMQ
jgi:hypothetical protein